MADHKSRPYNNFDLLRLVAASAVIFSHSFMIYGYDTSVVRKDFGKLWYYLERTYTYLQINGGPIGVYVFFLISGYLISKSIISNPAQGVYWKKRLLRIMPGLVVCVCLTVLILGTLMTTLPVQEYLLASETLGYFKTISIYHIGEFLPGVFKQNPLKEINGSLWTLRYELTCYIMVAAFSLLGIIRSRKAMLVAFCLMLIPVFWDVHFGLDSKIHHVLVYTNLDSIMLLKYMSYFQIGIVYNLFEKEISIKWWQATVAVAALFYLNFFGNDVLFVLQPIFYGVIVFYLSKLRLPEKIQYPLGRHDYSYGMYIYGMPVQQVVYTLVGGAVSIYAFVGLSLLLTLPFAMLSWHFVEKPMLALKPQTV